MTIAMNRDNMTSTNNNAMMIARIKIRREIAIGRCHMRGSSGVHVP